MQCRHCSQCPLPNRRVAIAPGYLRRSLRADILIPPNMKKTHFFLLLFLAALPLTAQQRYWHIEPESGAIAMTVKAGTAHSDHIEMAGRRVAAVLRYGVKADGTFTLARGMVWPMLRTVPNNTHASLMRSITTDPVGNIIVNGSRVTERVDTLRIDGKLEVESTLSRYGKPVARLTRTYFPSTESPALVEGYRLANISGNELRVEIPAIDQTIQTHPKSGVSGSYTIRLVTDKCGAVTLKPGDTHRFCATLSGTREGEKTPTLDYDLEAGRRTELVKKLKGNLVLESPDSVINEMFAFSKIRACESIYATKGGPMHGPGGESFYAAIWANDQAEYINPYFPFTGYDYGNASALNSFRHFARFMNKEWKAIPSSIIAEGDDIWAGAGDRGDAAMIAYGAARYALARGSETEARELWPLIEWCLEYTRRKLTKEGVPASDADELEGRFPAGDANLCTASLYYDALLSAAYLAEDLAMGRRLADNYRRQARTLAGNIERFFGANVEGFDTYRYYDGNDVLRAWICIPLTVGITERAEGTINALFSTRLWTENGLLTQAGDRTFWDRATLYALRGVYAAGHPDRAHEFMKAYSAERLLGSHVPYAIEAWPEGGKRHLSAESGLYGRIVTEGIFGIRPTGLNACTITPQLPSEWNNAALRRIQAFGTEFDIEIERKGKDRLQVRVVKNGKRVVTKNIRQGDSVRCAF